jgi:hypothetical protein
MLDVPAAQERPAGACCLLLLTSCVPLPRLCRVPMHIVHAQWIMDCLQQWAVLDEGEPASLALQPVSCV